MKKMSSTRYYLYKKEALRLEAIYWQIQTAEKSYSYNDVFEWQCYFEKMGKRYGLLREFRENGVI